MTEVFTEDEALARVVRLTRVRLAAYVEAEAVVPVRKGDQLLFGPAEIARLDLICELADLYDMGPEAVAVMLAVIDRLHEARRDRRALVEAILAEPPEVHARVAAVLAAAQDGRGA